MNATVTVYVEGYKTDIIDIPLEKIKEVVERAKENKWSYTWTDYDKTRPVATAPTMPNKKAEQQSCIHEWAKPYFGTNTQKWWKKCSKCDKVLPSQPEGESHFGY